MTSRRRTIALEGLGLLCLLVGGAARAASSRDYPGPCPGEKTVPGTPMYLSSDSSGNKRDARVLFLPEAGRLRLGISCVGTGFVVIRIGQDSALCQFAHKCTSDELATLTSEDVDWMQTSFPEQVPFKHVCKKHGFGWYDALAVPPGTYLVSSRSVAGHGTMDTYAYAGNGGAFQPVNCRH